MRRFSFIRLVVLAFAMLVMTSATALAAGGWSPVGTPGFSAGNAAYVSLFVYRDSDQVTPYVAYQDGGQKAMVMRYNGTEWENVGGPVSAGRADSESLYVYEGTPYLSYRDLTDFRIKVKKYDGTNWVDLGAAFRGFTSSLVVDNGIPYVAFKDDSAIDKAATVMKFTDTDGGTWELVGSSNFSGGPSEYVQLAIHQGTPYVAFVSNNRPAVMWYNPSSNSPSKWEFVGGSVVAETGAGGISLAIAADGTPYVAYMDKSSGYKATVQKYLDGDWVNVGGPGITPAMASYESLQIYDGTPYLAFQDEGAGHKASVIKYDGAGWVNLGAAGFSDSTVAYTTLLLDNGTPYLAYYDGAVGGKVTVMRFNANDAPTISAIADQTIEQNQSVPEMALTVGDTETATDQLTLSAVSSNTALVPNENIAFGGGGADRTVTVTPASGEAGTATITLTVTDADGGTANTSFTLRVLSSNPDLVDLTLSEGELDPGFASDETDYTARIRSTNDSITVTPTAAFGGSDIAVNGQSVASGQASEALAMNPGPNPVTVVVTAETGATRTYNLSVSRNQAPDSGGDTTVVNPAGAPVTIVKDSPRPSEPNIRLQVPHLGDLDGDTPSAVRIISLTGGTLEQADGTAITLGADGTILNLTDGGANLRFTPDAGRDVDATFDYVVVDPFEDTLNAVPAAASVTIANPPGISAIENKTIDQDTETSATVTVSDLESSVEELTLSGRSDNTALVPDARITFNGTGAERTVTVTPAAGQAGTATITVTVSDTDGATAQTSFTLRVLSSNPDLVDLTLSEGELDPDFASDVTDYTARIRSTTESITVTPTAAFDGSDITVNDQSVASGQASEALAMNPGPNPVTVVVTAETGPTRTYNLSVSRNQAPDSGGDTTVVNPAGAPVAVVKDSPRPSEANIRLQVPNLADVDGDTPSAVRIISLTGGTLEQADGTAISIGADGTVLNLTEGGANLRFTPDAGRDTDAAFDYVVVDPFELTLNAETATAVVTIASPPTITAIADQIINQDTGVAAIFTVGDLETPVIDLTLAGSSSSTDLVPNENIIFGGAAGDRTVSVVPAAGQAGTATITVTVTDGDGYTTATSFDLRVRSTDPDLSALNLSEGTLDSVFAADTTEYRAIVANAVTSVDVTATPEIAASTMAVDGAAVANGTPVTYNLPVGDTAITIVVTAEDTTTTRTYHLTIHRLSNDADLEALAFSGTLAPDFDPAKTDYRSVVANDVTSAELTATTADQLAAMTVSGVATESGDTVTVPLVVGDNVVPIQVTAEDGTVKTYTVTVHRLSNNANLAELAPSAGTLRPRFRAAITEYTVHMPRTVTSLDLMATVAEAHATLTINDQPVASGELTTIDVGSDPMDISVVVQAEDGTLRTYTIRVDRSSSGGAAPAPAPAPVPVPEPEEPATPEPQVEQVPIPVDMGHATDSIAETIIERTTESDGTVKDKVEFTPAQAEAAVAKLAGNEGATARIFLPDQEDRTAEQQINLPKAAVETLHKGNADLEIATNDAQITVPNQSLGGIADDVYFRVVAVKQKTERHAVEERAKENQMVVALQLEKAPVIVGRPMTIETNMQDHKVEITLPLAMDQVPTDPTARAQFLKDLAVYIEHSDGEKLLVKGELVPFGSGKLGVKFSVNKFSLFTIVSLEGWEKATSTPIAAESHVAYVKGYVDGEFKPLAAVTRGEMAAMLARALSPVKPDQISAAGFPDVIAGHWADPYVGFAKEKGLMSGYPDGSFRPQATITRAEMAAVAARLGNLAVSSQVPADSRNHWAADAIARVSAAGIMTGYPDGTFRPDDHLSRAEAVTVLNRLLGRGPLTGLVRATYSDVPATFWAFSDIEEASASHKFVRTDEQAEGLQEYIDQAAW